jgi:hypothetical protein
MKQAVLIKKIVLTFTFFKDKYNILQIAWMFKTNKQENIIYDVD